MARAPLGSFTHGTQSGYNKYRCRCPECTVAASKKRTCQECGLPSAGKTCHLCLRRRSPVVDVVPRECRQCGLTIEPTTSHRRRTAKFCSAVCRATAQRRPGYEDFERKQARAARDRAAGGLNEKQRRRLLRKWKSQGRACAYCDRLADTVDHVIPLSRGGDNFEGNLVPACLSCNSRKKDRLLIEWRTGRCASSTFTRPRRKPNRPRPKVRPREIGAVRGTQMEMVFGTCCVCCETFVGLGRPKSQTTTCDDPHCIREHVGRTVRDKYRESQGYPVDPSEPTIYWIRLHGLPDTRVRMNRRKKVA